MISVFCGIPLYVCHWETLEWEWDGMFIRKWEVNDDGDQSFD